MKRIFILLCLVALVFGITGTASAILFDFDSLPVDSGDADIEVYMESIYGSDISVTGALIKNDGLLGPDNFLTAAGPEDQFLITFLDRPIPSIAFDYGLEHHQLFMDADGTKLVDRRWAEERIGYGVRVFADYGLDDVSTLRFYGNTGRGRFMIDNLEIMHPTPEPATLLLVGSGLLGLGGIGRKRLMRR